MLPSPRKAELRRCLENEMPSILHLVVSLLAHSRDDRSFELASGAMACVAAYVEAGCVPASLCQGVCEEVFKVLQGSDAQGHLLIQSQLGTEAIRVLTEVSCGSMIDRSILEGDNLRPSISVSCWPLFTILTRGTAVWWHRC
jgi:hypothetical protein